ncbi:MAG: nucleotidyltransferase domain-containing protein [Candidatus Ratteibacteria bacterium]
MNRYLDWMKQAKRDIESAKIEKENRKIYYLNKEKVIEELKKRIKKCVEEKKEIKKIILFGSFAKNIPTVFSDIDLVFIIEDTQKKFMDRFLDYIDFFTGFGISVDLFVYTEKEENLNIPFLENAKKEGILVYSKYGDKNE